MNVEADSSYWYVAALMIARADANVISETIKQRSVAIERSIDN
jgi:hypothetical protein|tara:strand:+ start:51454 stop:51582 length:129 start_codon:yes stop_codon:yes gene_type:complete